MGPGNLLDSSRAGGHLTNQVDENWSKRSRRQGLRAIYIVLSISSIAIYIVLSVESAAYIVLLN
jgi:hypothetical protein